MAKLDFQDNYTGESLRPLKKPEIVIVTNPLKIIHHKWLEREEIKGLLFYMPEFQKSVDIVLIVICFVHLHYIFKCCLLRP